MNAGIEFRKGFLTMLETLGSQVIIHRNFSCSNVELFEIKGLKNSEKDNSSKVMFQFPDKFEIKDGDAIQQKGTDNYWRVYRVEDRVIADVYHSFITHVNRIDSKGNAIS